MASFQNQSPDNVIVIPDDNDVEKFQSSAGKLVEISKKKIEATRELVEAGKIVINKSMEGKETKYPGTVSISTIKSYESEDPIKRLEMILEAALATEKALKDLYKACAEMNLEVVDDSALEDVQDAYGEAMIEINEAARDVYSGACELEFVNRY